jgi:hypothetical protein
MYRGTLDPDVKRTSVLRRVSEFDSIHYYPSIASEGDVCAFGVVRDGSAIVVEAVSGRSLILAPGDIFLGTPAHRESTRWVVGGIPAGGLVPGHIYWVLAESGIVGDLIGNSPSSKQHLERVEYLGTLHDDTGPINIRQFALQPAKDGSTDQGASLFVIVGTAAEVGKTTAGTVVLRALRAKGHVALAVLKATGTSSFGELAVYLDFGASQAFDCVDFGLPTTYPSGRSDMDGFFDAMLDTCLSTRAEAVIIECGGDILGANVPVFLNRLNGRRSDAKIILAASDALAALGGTRTLQEMGMSVHMITGPCTDTPILLQRTQNLCNTPAVNMLSGNAENVPF